MLTKKIIIYLGLLSISLTYANELSFLQRVFEPTGPSLNPTISNLARVTYFFTSSNDFTNPLVNAVRPAWQDKWLNYNKRDGLLYLIKQNYLDKVNNQLYLQQLFSSVLFLDCIVTPLLTQCRFLKGLDRLYNNNLMSIKAKYLIYDIIKDISKQKCYELYTNNDSRLLYLCLFMNIATVSIVAFCQYITPDLFNQKTYFNLRSLTWEKHWLLYVLWIWCKNNPSRTDSIGKLHLTYTTYTIDNLLTDLDAIFEAKRMLFSICILLTCFGLKPAKTLFTNPYYWMPICITQVLFIKNKCPNTIMSYFQKNKNIRKNYNNLPYHYQKIIDYLLWCPILITIVFVNATYNTVLKKPTTTPSL